MTDPVQHPYKVTVPSGFGMMRKIYYVYCRKTFGRKRSVWDIESYQWDYRFSFKNEADATMFALKWK